MFFFFVPGVMLDRNPLCPSLEGFDQAVFFVAPTQVFDRYLTHWYPLLVISFSSLWACLKKGHLQRHTHTQKKNWWNKKHQKTGHRKKQAIAKNRPYPAAGGAYVPADVCCGGQPPWHANLSLGWGCDPFPKHKRRSYFWRLRQWVGLRENLNQKAWFLPLLGGFLLVFP